MMYATRNLAEVTDVFDRLGTLNEKELNYFYRADDNKAFLKEFGVRKDVYTISITTDYIMDRYQAEFFDNTIFYLGVCHGYSDSRFNEFLYSRGAQCVAGYPYSINIDLERKIFEIFINKLMPQSNTKASPIIEDTVPYHLNPVYSALKKTSAALAKLYGEDNNTGELYVYANPDFTYRNSGDLKGRIKERGTNESIKNIAIEAWRFENQEFVYKTEVRSKEDGSFEFSDLPWGVYDLHVMGEGIESTHVSYCLKTDTASGGDILVDTAPLDGFTTIALNTESFMAIRNDNSLWGWGKYTKIEIDDTIIAAYSKISKLTDDVICIAAGREHSEFIKSYLSFWIWGSNQFGNFGNGKKENGSTYIQVPVKAMDDIISVSAGEYYTLALKDDGTLWAWGRNNWFQLGSGGSNADSFIPIKIMDDVASISAGGEHAAAIKTDGSLWVWGYNGFGQLGLGNEIGYANVPTHIMDDVTFVSTGYNHTVAIKSDGSLWVWGNNEYGMVGDGTVSKYDHRYNGFVTDNSKYEPLKIMDDVVTAATGRWHTAAVKSDGSLWVWGDNRYGQIGDGTKTSKLSPVKIMDGVDSVYAKGSRTSVIKTDSTLWSWGDRVYEPTQVF